MQYLVEIHELQAELYVFETRGIANFGTRCGTVYRSVVDDAVDEWRKRLRACVKEKGRHFKHLL